MYCGVYLYMYTVYCIYIILCLFSTFTIHRNLFDVATSRPPVAVFVLNMVVIHWIFTHRIAGV